ncbi:PIN domain-containing protein [Paraburkholderia aspalathi]|uniref:PIN domain-containing protein n=1 Tax=Paraburkholderia aspalathi TaxID=1324617 RepID=UPI0038B9E9E5
MDEHKEHVVHVMLDTNVVFSPKNMLHVFSRAAETVIRESSAHTDLAVRWMIPAMVRSERIWQMRGLAVTHLNATRNMQKLFGQTWVENEDAIANAITKTVDEQLRSLSVETVECNVSLVDWTTLISAAALRLPPFSPGDSEKGFRDAIICETICQQIEQTPLGDEACIVVSGDDLLRKTIGERLGLTTSVKIVSSLDELRNEINFLLSPIDAETAQDLALKAGEVFGSSGLWTNFRDQLFSDFASELRAAPGEVVDVRLGQSWLSLPVFIRKQGSRLEFASIFTCERTGRAWVRDVPQIGPSSFIDDVRRLASLAGSGAGSDLPPSSFIEDLRRLASLAGSGAGVDQDDKKEPPPLSGVAGAAGILAASQASPPPPPPQKAGLTLAALADYQQAGRWETVALPELHFSFVWSARYDSTGLISDPRKESIVAEPF